MRAAAAAVEGALLARLLAQQPGCQRWHPAPRPVHRYLPQDLDSCLADHPLPRPRPQRRRPRRPAPPLRGAAARPPPSPPRNTAPHLNAQGSGGSGSLVSWQVCRWPLAKAGADAVTSIACGIAAAAQANDTPWHRRIAGATQAAQGASHTAATEEGTLVKSHGLLPPPLGRRRLWRAAGKPGQRRHVRLGLHFSKRSTRAADGLSELLRSVQPAVQACLPGPSHAMPCSTIHPTSRLTPNLRHPPPPPPPPHTTHTHHHQQGPTLCRCSGS